MNSIHILLSIPHDNFTMLLLILLKWVSFRIIFFLSVKNRLGHFSVASTLFIIIIIIVIIIIIPIVNRKKVLSSYIWIHSA